VAEELVEHASVLRLRLASVPASIILQPAELPATLPVPLGRPTEATSNKTMTKPSRAAMASSQPWE
jgi:hypothetical protein